MTTELTFTILKLLPAAKMLLCCALLVRFVWRRSMFSEPAPFFCLAISLLTVRTGLYLSEMWRTYNFLEWPFTILLLLTAAESVSQSALTAEDRTYSSSRFWLCFFCGCFLGWISHEFGIAAAPARAAIEVTSGAMLLISIVTLILTLTFSLNRFSNWNIVERQLGLLLYTIGAIISSRLPVEARHEWIWWHATLTTEVCKILALILFHLSWPQGSPSVSRAIRTAPKAGKHRSSFRLEYKPFQPTPRRSDPRS